MKLNPIASALWAAHWLQDIYIIKSVDTMAEFIAKEKAKAQ
jgi:hypothetical protein